MSDISVSVDQRAIERGSFSGNAKEYFGIWIVNILLTIVTIGIYSAWAKVRRKRYFNGNTVLAGRAFGYHATGGQIFKGRLIAFAFIVISQAHRSYPSVPGLRAGNPADDLLSMADHAQHSFQCAGDELSQCAF